MRKPLLLAVLLCVGCLGASILYGARPIPAGAVVSAILRYEPADESQRIVRDYRLPRAVAAGLVGAALATAGAIMQGLTRNPLASPSLFGLSSGAALFGVLGMASGIPMSFLSRMGISVAGATLGAGLVFGLTISFRAAATPVRVALAGAAVSTLLSSLAGGLVHQQGLAHDALSWFGRGVRNVGWVEVGIFAAACVPGMVLAMMTAPGLTVLSLGEEPARGLGQRPETLFAVGGLATLVLAGSAVSLAGTIPFVGLMMPHLARAVVGVDYRRIIPLSAAFGSALLLLSDVVARWLTVKEGSPIPVGLVTTVLGLPFLLSLIRRMRLAG